MVIRNKKPKLRKTTLKSVPKKEYVLLVSEKVELELKSALIHMVDKELFWFGEINKINKTTFELVNLFFPPQINRSAYVETDDKHFPKWQFDNLVKTGKVQNIRLHGHSHPTFQVFPSGTDTAEINKVLEEVDDYYIQMIINNKLQTYLKYHDKKTGEVIDMRIEFKTQKEVAEKLDKVVHIQTYTPPSYIITAGGYGYTKTSKPFIISDHEPFILPDEKHYQDSFEDYLEDFNIRFYEDIAYYEPEPDIEQYDDERGIDIEFK